MPRLSKRYWGDELPCAEMEREKIWQLTRTVKEISVDLLRDRMVANFDSLRNRSTMGIIEGHCR
nr:hypothetical protein [uncultured Lachnoclostridium sp.]